MDTSEQYDLIVIGSGPAGEKAAVHAACHGYRVAVVEEQPVLGGAGVNTGTIPSKTLRETAVYLSGRRERGLYGIDRTLEREPEAEDFLFRERFVVRTEGELSRLELLEDKVELLSCTASFVDAHHVRIRSADGEQTLGARFMLGKGSDKARGSNALRVEKFCLRLRLARPGTRRAPSLNQQIQKASSEESAALARGASFCITDGKSSSPLVLP